MIHVYLIGDSTMSTYEDIRAPRTGWGQVLGKYFDQQVRVINKAAPGRSSKSFMEEGLFSSFSSSLTSHDYVFIQFGHNDQKPDKERSTKPFTTYQNYLRYYVTVVQKAAATPVLLTSVQRRRFNDAGELEETHGSYPDAMRELADSMSIPLIDVTKKSTQLLKQYGPEKSKRLFMWMEPGVYDYYPNGEQDDTHFSYFGANEIAKLVLNGIKDLDLPLAKHIMDER
ncbi:rhamnogalacturonan acetylesterase [Radiobacillus kanasensis]|uniref:rhamnogalacturonan acetylesterase n=1 Tax=Radiobacillus kanasensis TaxID=2844358 RepID=UPI001E46A149|nr:rhamnogalacturonan acetylesterase [Radiobacillus kanasensis]UFT98751.1 rhamnogalacturonan acetylesterase [Radiobacillus kanasensis]